MAEPNELALSGGGKIASTVSDALTKQLCELCDLASDAGEAVIAIRNAGLLKQARDAFPRVKMLAGPMAQEVLYAELQPLVIVFGTPAVEDSEEGKALETAWWQIYLKALAPLPREALVEAVDQWIAGGKPFFPKPSELHKLAQPAASRARTLAWRIQKAAEYQEARDSRTPAEETKQVGQGFGALADELKTMAPKRIPDVAVVRPSKPDDAFVRDLVRQGVQKPSAPRSY